MAPISKHPAADDIRTRLARAADLPVTEIVELIARDLEQHWQQGERVLVETYLAALPRTLDDDARMDLIYTEMVVREGTGDRPELAEYTFRFPELVERIQTQFLLHRALSDLAEDKPAAAPEPPPEFPQIVPGYEILQELGKGGAGIVYKARHLELGRTVALKLLRSNSWDREPQLRLRREAEALARLQHPHIVQIYEVGLANGQPYLALEYVSGGTLDDRLRAGPMKMSDVVALVRMVALAVHAAHEQGLVHRDLKPANILLPSPLTPATGTEGETAVRSGVIPEPAVKVTDFGLVKRLDQSDFSRTGELLGTPTYMAPEQAAGRKDVGPAADVYALGAILYEGLSGRPPFQGDSTISMLTQVASAEPIPPSRLRRGISRDLEAVVLKCLEKGPTQRYASAAALAEDLRRFLAGEPTQARPLSVIGRAVKLVRRHPLPAGLLVLAAVSLLGGLMGILWQWGEAIQARGNLQIALRSEAELRRESEQNLYQSRIAQAALLWEDAQTAQARDILAACRPRTGAIDLRGWEWDYLNRLFHAEVRTLRLPGSVTGLALCPNNPSSPDQLAVALVPSGLNLRQRASEKMVAAFVQPSGGPESIRSVPIVSGDTIAVAVQPQGSLVASITSDRKVFVSDRTSGQLLRSVRLQNASKAICFTPEGDLLVGGSSKGIQELDPATLETIAEHAVASGFTDVMATQAAGPLLAVSNSPTAKLLVYERPTYRLVKDLSFLVVGLEALAFSPDGNRLAAGYQSGVVRVWETKSWREIQRFQGMTGPIHALAFHPSSLLLATGGADRIVRLWHVITGKSTAVYRGHEADVLGLAFGPRGDWLASGSRDQTVRIWDSTHDPQGQLLAFQMVNLGKFASTPVPGDLTVQTSTIESKVLAWVSSAGRPLVQTELDRRDDFAYPLQRSAILSAGRVANLSRANPRTVAIWGPNDSRPHRVLSAGEGAVQSVATDHTGRCLVWAAAAKEGVAIHRWDSTTEVQAEPILLDAPTVHSLTIESPDGWLVAVTSQGKLDGEWRVWAIDSTGKGPPREVVRDTQPIGGIAFHPVGRELAVAVGDTVSLYRLGDWKLVQKFSCLAPATALAYSPDGRRLAAVSEDGMVTLTDPATGKALFQLHSLGRPRVRAVSHNAQVAFSPNGARLVSTNWDGTFNLWDGSPHPDPEDLLLKR
jgi:serine/threonine protein kinase/WD40 repeat protein